jgi:glycerate-2-kinase
MAMTAARQCAEDLGYDSEIITSGLHGEAREAASFVTELARARAPHNRKSPRPICLLFGGETTVTVRGNGSGGRCQEFAVAALEGMRDLDGDYLIAACGTDGTDGPTEAAGGFASPEVAAEARRYGLNTADVLARNDSYDFLRQTHGLIVTGPTGTNVMDVYLALMP